MIKWRSVHLLANIIDRGNTWISNKASWAAHAHEYVDQLSQQFQICGTIYQLKIERSHQVNGIKIVNLIFQVPARHTDDDPRADRCFQ